MNQPSIDAQPLATPSFDDMRAAMVASQLRTTGVNDPAVVAAMGEVPREAFVPEDKRPIAYAELAIPLGNGRAMLPPMVLGQLLTEGEINPGEKALVVGGATGYSAALLSAMKARVTLLDSAEFPRSPALPEDVAIITGPLESGYKKGAPYDIILIDGAVELIPPALIDQLADGGRLLAVRIGDDGVGRAVVGHKAGEAFGLRYFGDAPPSARLPGFEQKRGFSF